MSVSEKVKSVTSNGTIAKVAISLVIVGIIGAIGNFANVAAIKATVEAIDKRIDRIEAKVDAYMLREHK